jgi:hypothetical protein
MKITRTKTEVFEFDLDEEIKRLHSCFKGKQLKRQLAILDAIFKEKDLKKAQQLIDALPRCKERECSEAEYCGMWMSIFGASWGLYPVSVDVVIDYEKQNY